jgi:hypothetical protein
MAKVAAKPQTPEQRLAALWARINAKPAYKMPEVCKHGFPRGEQDGQGCPAGD